MTNDPKILTRAHAAWTADPLTVSGLYTAAAKMPFVSGWCEGYAAGLAEAAKTPTKQPETVIESETRRGCVTCANAATKSHLEPCLSCIRGVLGMVVYCCWTPKPVDK